MLKRGSRSHRESGESESAFPLKKVLFLILFSLLSFAVVLCGGGVILNQLKGSSNVTQILAYTVLIASGLLCGFWAGRLFRQKGLLLGLLSVLPLYIALLVCSLCFSGGHIGSSIFLKLPILLLCGALGGIFGVNLRKKRK